MLDYIRNHQRLMFFVLLLFIAPPFLLWGLQGYTGMRQGVTGVGSVDGQPITQRDFDDAQREQLDLLRQRYGPNFDAKLLDDPKQRERVLDNLVTRRVMLAQASHSRLAVSDKLVAQKLAEDPNVKSLYGPDGRLDNARYDQLLAMIGKTRAQVFEGVRQSLLLREVAGTVPESALAPQLLGAQLNTLLAQQREVSELSFKPADYKAEVKLAADAVEKYYTAHPGEFQIPEQVDIQYLSFDEKALAQGTVVTDADARAYYDSHATLYQTPEQRRASHILIAVPKDAAADVRNKARARAQELLAQVRAHPGDFAKLARENSQDPGSAAKGGDLDWAPLTNYVEPFAKALGALKENQISDVVETEFGYHIIIATGIKAAHEKPFDDVKADIEAQLRTQRARDQFAQTAEDFRNLVYQDADSLEPAATKFGLKIQTASNVTRVPLPGNRTPLATPKLLSALFSDDVLKSKHNTDAIEVGPDALIAARVTAYRPAQLKSLADVADGIRNKLTSEEAARLAKVAGEAKLSALRASKDAAKDTTGFTPTKLIGRANAQGFAPSAVTEIFKADASTLPTLTSAVLPDGTFAIYRISRVDQPAAGDPARAAGLAQELVRAQGELELDAYTAALKSKYKVTTSLPALSGDDADKSGAPAS